MARSSSFLLTKLFSMKIGSSASTICTMTKKYSEAWSLKRDGSDLSHERLIFHDLYLHVRTNPLWDVICYLSFNYKSASFAFENYRRIECLTSSVKKQYWMFFFRFPDVILSFITWNLFSWSVHVYRQKISDMLLMTSAYCFDISIYFLIFAIWIRKTWGSYVRSFCAGYSIRLHQLILGFSCHP